ncbi:ribonuclease domain-containing protein [[Pseudomonas] boreopolis]|uniref:ribonuclease domain-containing protein n=1 Tax=Xanthomonas boreopolis TaxID=86183 RepID=UPI003DA0C8C0
MRRPALLITAIVLLVAGLWGMRQVQQPHPQFAPQSDLPAVAEARRAPAPASTGSMDGLPAFLPTEARDTIALVRRGGPFPHRQDGSVFGNRERRLPDRPRGYYHEYTVDTPGSRDRGARRIVTGGTPPEIWYYTDDHYETFKSFSVPEDVR